MSPQMLTLHPIGVIRTNYREAAQTPRQPGTSESEGKTRGVARIVLEKGHNFEQALHDLEGFDKIWVVYWFDRNENWKPMVLPPRSSVKRGLFATRSPHRPNPIGLSLVTLHGIQGLTLSISEIDALDNTPVLDIKPYLSEIEAWPDARQGWVDSILAPQYTVEFSLLATDQLEFLRSVGVEIGESIERALQRDPAPHPYRRIWRQPDGGFYMAIKSWRADFSIEGQCITISRIRSGYKKKALEVSPAPDQSEIHLAFHARWEQV